MTMGNNYVTERQHNSAFCYTSKFQVAIIFRCGNDAVSNYDNLVDMTPFIEFCFFFLLAEGSSLLQFL